MKIEDRKRATRILSEAGKHLVKANLWSLEHVHALKTFTAIDGSKSQNPDIQALALISVLIARVIEVKDDGWVAIACQNLGL